MKVGDRSRRRHEGFLFNSYYTSILEVVWVLWHINLCWSFNAKFCLYIHTYLTKDFKTNIKVGKISICRISFVCTRLTSFKLSYFLYHSVSLKKDRMSSILTFSNRSVKLFTLKNRFLITAKVLHSIRMCLTVQVVWHCGCGSCFKMKEWVGLVWPIHNRYITTCSLLDFLDDSLHSPKVGWIWKSLLWMLLLHCCCHFVWRNLLIVGFRSVYGILDISGVRSVLERALLLSPDYSILLVIRTL